MKSPPWSVPVPLDRIVAARRPGRPARRLAARLGEAWPGPVAGEQPAGAARHFRPSTVPVKGLRTGRLAGSWGVAARRGGRADALTDGRPLIIPVCFCLPGACSSCLSRRSPGAVDRVRRDAGAARLLEAFVFLRAAFHTGDRRSVAAVHFAGGGIGPAANARRVSSSGSCSGGFLARPDGCAFRQAASRSCRACWSNTTGRCGGDPDGDRGDLHPDDASLGGTGRRAISETRLGTILPGPHWSPVSMAAQAATTAASWRPCNTLRRFIIAGRSACNSARSSGAIALLIGGSATTTYVLLVFGMDVSARTVVSW